MNIDNFRKFIAGLIAKIIGDADAINKAQQVTIKELSDKLTLANEKIKALSGVDEQLKAQMQELDDLSTELANTYNPTPASDAAIKVADENLNGMIVPETVDTNKPTDPSLVVDAVDALVTDPIID
jgi:septal ring factor EnvC (AmiA/AmiB activator)